MPKLRQIVTPDTHEVSVLKAALDSRQASEPVIREIRGALSKPVPSWATKLSTDVEIDSERASELRSALESRLAQVEKFAPGPKRDLLIERTREALAVMDGFGSAVPSEQVGARAV